MSYSQKFRRTISVPYSGTVRVSYPASEHGGTVTEHYSGTAYEDVEVDILVDTHPFDRSIDGCNGSVTGLTASVAAMNAAQCAAISANADKVATTIVNGFFQTVKTDLSTQIAELKQKLDARLILLQQQKKTLLELQNKMGEDYARTSARYTKIFSELNDELSNRIEDVIDRALTIIENKKWENDI